MAFNSGIMGSTLKGIPVPGLAARIEVPDVYVETARGRSMHRQVTQDAARDTLKWHNRIIMREHFKQTNRAKYDHVERLPATKSKKKRRFNSVTDLKKTGRSKNEFLAKSPRVSFKQSGSEGIVFAYQRYKWHFPKREAPLEHGKVTVQVMNEEVTRWTEDESRRSARVFAKSWAKHYRHKISGRKKLTNLIGPQL